MKPGATVKVSRRVVLAENNEPESVVEIEVAYAGYGSGIIVLDTTADLLRLREAIDSFLRGDTPEPAS